MNVGFLQVLLIVAVVVVLFGGKHLGRLGTELGRGLRGVKKGLSDEGPASKKASSDGSQPAWVQSAVDVAKTAQQVRKATRMGRRFPFS